MKLTLQELLEQKALLEKHLGWLNRKITALDAQPDDPVATPPPTPDLPPEGAVVATLVAKQEAAPVASSDDFVMPMPTSTNLAADAKQGCLLWFMGLCLICGLLVALIYFFYPSWDDEKVEQYRAKVRGVPTRQGTSVNQAPVNNLPDKEKQPTAVPDGETIRSEAANDFEAPDDIEDLEGMEIPLPPNFPNDSP